MRKKLLVILLCCLAGAALAAGSAVWWASRHMRTPEFRAEFARMLHDATGREVSIESDLEISVFPWFGLSARGVSLANDPDFGPTPLLTAKKLSAHIKVLPLFSRRLVFDTVELEEADLALVLDAEDRGNWDRLLERIRAQENATGDSEAFFRKMTVRGFRLIAAKARLDDIKHNHSYIATDVDLRTGRIESGKLLPFTVACNFHWPRPGLSAHLEATGKLDWSGAKGAPLFVETTVQGEIGGTFMPAGAPRAAITAALSMENGNNDLHLAGAKLKVLGVEVAGDVTFYEVTERFRMEARLNLERFNPRSVINAYWPAAVAVEHPNALHEAEGPLNLSANEDELTFSTPGFRLDGAKLHGKVRLGFDDTPGLDFELTADRLDADAYAAAFTANATGAPLVVEDLPLSYLSRLAGHGRLAAETLKLAGVQAQGAEALWQAAGGVHKAQLKPARAQGGSVSWDLTASFTPAALPDSAAAAASAAPEKPGKPDAANKMANKAAKPPKSTQPVPPGQAVLGFSGSLRLDGVDARQVSWLNRPGFTTSGKLDLRARIDAPRAPAAGSLRLGAVLRRGVADVSAGIGPATLEWEADRAQPKAQPRRMTLSSIQVQAHLVPTAAKDAAKDADWSVQADGTLSAVGMKPVLNLDARGSGLLQGLHGKTRLTGAAISGKLKGWFLPRREPEASFSARGGLDFSSQNLNLGSLSVQACGVSLVGTLTGTQVLGGNFALGGRIRCQDGDPRRVLSALDIRVPAKPADRHVLSRLSGEADVSLNSKGLQLANVNAQVDDTQVRGTYGLLGFDSPRQTFALAAGFLDVDRYLPPREPLRRPGQPEPRPAPEPLPVESVRDLSAEGSLAFRSFKLHGLTVRGLKLGVQAQGGLLTVKPLSGSFYEGELSGEFSAQVVQGGLQTRLALAAKDFQAGPFMLGWVGKEYVTGRTDMFLDVTGTGATDTDVLRTLEGLAEFRITDGSYLLSGAASAPPEAQSQAPVRRTPPGATPQVTQPSASPPSAASLRRPGTPFRQAAARLKVRGGVFSSDDFRLDGPNIAVTGKGRFSPAEDTILVGLTANMPGVPDVPIRVFGRLRDPEMEIPTGVLINNTIKEILGLPLKPIKFFKDLLF